MRSEGAADATHGVAAPLLERRRTDLKDTSVAVIIPCYRVREQVPGVIARIGPEVGRIFVVDDACPEKTADHVERNCKDPRVRVIRLPENRGVGGAVLAGYEAALAESWDIFVKVDGDGQMNPDLIPDLVAPIAAQRADYCKGNRFYFLDGVRTMPGIRLFGNAVLSFMSKLSTGYWQIFDPTNGFTAISRVAASRLELDRVARRYFFESDLLFHLALLRAVVVDVPMRAVYDDEPSSLKPARILLPFLAGHMRNFARRLLYMYFVRGFSVASLELVLGPALLAFSAVFGFRAWLLSYLSGHPATAGTVMLAALPAIMGLQLLLSWLQFDVHGEPRLPLGETSVNRRGARNAQSNGVKRSSAGS